MHMNPANPLANHHYHVFVHFNDRFKIPDRRVSAVFDILAHHHKPQVILLYNYRLFMFFSI